MMTFDAAGREVCVVRENRTNTPLQALDLMNDVTYLETARVLAEHMMTEGGTTPPSASRSPSTEPRRDLSAAESRTLLDSFQYYRDAYQTDSDAARKLVSHADILAIRESLMSLRLAAYTKIASLILNLDELLTSSRIMPPSHGRACPLDDASALLRRSSAGLGTAVLATLLTRSLAALNLANPDGGLPGLPHFPPKAKRVIYLTRGARLLN